ncbi:hypothetical protein SAMN05216167_101463 [Spirosoma endophyticum]|uniref:Uncharacterized protein n=1 Tax=Spirosoma endophyticum TaxID=662367 RepID=A0A1I1GKW5_9BACT|nr:hypothetical protein SAMN05216167_101463 [Spirosoma endophyticum]
MESIALRNIYGSCSEATLSTTQLGEGYINPEKYLLRKGLMTLIVVPKAIDTAHVSSKHDRINSLLELFSYQIGDYCFHFWGKLIRKVILFLLIV